MSDDPVCVPVEDPPARLLPVPKALIDALPIGPVDSVRGGDKLDAGNAVFEDPLRPADGSTEDGALRLAGVEPGLVEGTACVSTELVDKPLPLTVVFANVFPIGTQGADDPSRLLGV